MTTAGDAPPRGPHPGRRDSGVPDRTGDIPFEVDHLAVISRPLSSRFFERTLPTPKTGHRAIDAVLFAIGLAILLSSLFVVVAHLQDRFGVSHVAGCWMALTRWAYDGVLYPPLYDGAGHYGGTRFMPLTILLNMGAAKLTGEFVTSAKLVSAISTCAVMATAYVAMRRAGCSRSVSVALMASILATEAGMLSLTSFRGDTVPLWLQLSAVMIINRPSPTRRRIVISAALCVLAVLAKTSAGWAPMAIGLFLLAEDRKGLAVFMVTFAAFLGIGMGFFDWLTDGRMLDNLRQLSGANLQVFGSLLGSPGKLNYILIHSLIVTWFLVPVVVLGLIFGITARAVTVHQIAWLGSFAVLMVVLADPGTSLNHTLDFVTLTVICTGELWRRSLDEQDRPLPLRGVFTALLVWAMVGGFDAIVMDELRDSVTHARADENRLDVLSDHVFPQDVILSEDPALQVLMNQTPTLVDPYMLARIDRRHPELVDPLIERLERKEFTKVVLLQPVTGSGSWYVTGHFGPRITDAIVRNYQHVAKLYTYQIWVPRIGPAVLPGNTADDNED